MAELLVAQAVPDPGIGALAALLVFIGASVWLGTVAQRVVERSSFVKGYFLGNRALGAWAVALTATVQSGGTFMGFPSLVYSYGWVVALWIGSYMVVPITGFGILGKRIAQLSRRTHAVTMPDLFRERFGSPAVGLVTSLLIILFMSFMMVAQFKAGALIMKLSWPGSGALALAEDVAGGMDRAYYVGLAVFALTVVGYTLIGGFLAAVWTDLFQSLMMFVGIMLLLVLVVPMAGGLENASRQSVAALAQTSAATSPVTTGYPATADAYLHGPGYSPDGRAFLPLGLAFSFFVFWPFTGMASPATVVRIMACKDTRTLRHSVLLLCLYNLGIYLPLIVICICARAIMPNVAQSDEIIPRMALMATQRLPLGSFLAGLVLAAPFGAVMATVSSYLVVIASGLVRDVYQRFFNPQANRYQLRRLSNFVMVLVGIIAVAANIRPPGFLQTVVVFSTGCAASAFVVPTFMLCYWRRATAPGVIAALLGGAATALLLFVWGLLVPDPGMGPAKGLRPFYLLGLEPTLWGLAMSLVAGISVSLVTRPPDDRILSQLFDEQPGSADAR